MDGEDLVSEMRPSKAQPHRTGTKVTGRPHHVSWAPSTPTSLRAWVGFASSDTSVIVADEGEDFEVGVGSCGSIIGAVWRKSSMSMSIWAWFCLLPAELVCWSRRSRTVGVARSQFLLLADGSGWVEEVFSARRGSYVGSVRRKVNAKTHVH